MLHALVLGLLLGLLACAAIEDVRSRRLPNWATAAIALLYPVHVLASPAPVAWPIALAIGAALFAAGALLFAWRVLGGGDVKLIAALGLWSGPEHLALFALVTAFSGGALALGYLWYERQGWLLLAPLAAALAGRRPAGVPAQPAAPAAEDATPAAAAARPSVPYGVAIAAGGVAVLYHILGL
ncbi:MAG TPA: prepilin peptidase [Geminicoccaceae bacterium]|nr:prepilin peptidase [Geminicoccaceae bacterium]